MLFVAACQGPSSNYLNNGIGSQLAPSDIQAATRLQGQYFKLLCAQAGFADCVLPVYDRGMWTLIVQQGMNDIDRRCDAYLEWLDDRKRSKGPLLSQINDIQSTTASVLAVVSPGSKAISLVGYAFGLLNRSVENYSSRLILEVESSTINSVVLRARHDFREAVADRAFQSRPEAEYALRSYLRLCLPFAIETNINDYSTLGSRGILVDEGNTINQAPVLNKVVGAAILESIPKRGAQEEAEPQKPTPQNDFLTKSVRLTADERAMTPGLPAKIQRALCLSPDDGIFGNSTRTAIAQAKAGILFFQPGFHTDRKDTLNVVMIDFFSKQSSCVNHERGYQNAFEKYGYPDADRVKSFQTGLQACDTVLGQKSDPSFKSKLQITGAFDEQTRAVIKTARAGLKLADGKTVDAELQTQLGKCLD